MGETKILKRMCKICKGFTKNSPEQCIWGVTSLLSQFNLLYYQPKVSLSTGNKSLRYGRYPIPDPISSLHLWIRWKVCGFSPRDQQHFSDKQLLNLGGGLRSCSTFWRKYSTVPYYCWSSLFFSLQHEIHWARRQDKTEKSIYRWILRISYHDSIINKRLYNPQTELLSFLRHLSSKLHRRFQKDTRQGSKVFDIACWSRWNMSIGFTDKWYYYAST